MPQRQPDALVRLERLGLPDDLVESALSAVQVVGAVVHGERVGLAVQLEPPPRDAVGVAADDGTEVR